MSVLRSYYCKLLNHNAEIDTRAVVSEWPEQDTQGEAKQTGWLPGSGREQAFVLKCFEDWG